MVRRILLSSAVTVMGLTFATGIASAKPYNSKTTINTNINATLNVNNVGVVNANSQFAVSGSAFVLGNTKGGDVTTGDATNVNLTNTVVVVNNKTEN